MNTLPAALFVIDPHHEHIAVDEANKLGVPVVALTDTNCNPDLISYLIPGNDDAIRSIKLVTTAVAEACMFGQQRRRDFMQAGRREDGAAGGGGGVQVEFASKRNRGSFAPPAPPAAEGTEG
jgi:small subunit ribosomal protein S2